MFRSSFLASALLCMTLTTACGEDAADMQRSANAAQDVANTKIDDVTADADQDIRTAQAAADKTVAAEWADFRTLREDYRHTTKINLVELDKKVSDIEARALKENGAKKADLEAKLKVIHADRDTFMNDYKGLEDETASTWDATKARMDARWSDLASRVEGV